MNDPKKTGAASSSASSSTAPASNQDHTAAAEAEAKAKREAEDAELAAMEAEEKAKQAEAAAKSAKGKPAKRERFYVVGPGSVMFEGRAYPALAQLELTEAEASSLGANVAPGKAPRPASDDVIEQRKAGRYVVAGPGQVMFGGKPRSKGFPLTLDEAEARKLGAAVTPADD